MKRIILLVMTLLFTSLPVAHAVATPSCSAIKSASVKKGIFLPCLNGSGGAFYEGIRGPVLVNVWGSWCEPCQQEIPRLVKAASTKKIAIIGIDVEERKMAAGRAFVASHKMSWPQLYDEKASTRGIFGMGVPVTWFIDGSGKVVYKQVGLFVSDRQIPQLVKKYFGSTL